MKKLTPYLVYAIVSLITFMISFAIVPLSGIDFSTNETIMYALLFSQPSSVISFIFSKNAVENQIFWDAYHTLKLQMELDPSGNFDTEIEKLMGLIKSSSHRAALKGLTNGK